MEVFFGKVVILMGQLQAGFIAGGSAEGRVAGMFFV